MIHYDISTQKKAANFIDVITTGKDFKYRCYEVYKEVVLMKVGLSKMMSELSLINRGNETKFHIDLGCGKALFDNPNIPTKRYFLEKRWRKGDRIIAVIMTNPSTANSLSSDKTVEFLLEYARGSSRDYDALFVVNIIPLIDSSTTKLKKRSKSIISQSVKEDMNRESFKHTLSNSKEIILAWGKMGQDYFKDLIEDEDIKKLFCEKSAFCKVFGFGKDKKFPKHPRPNNCDKYVFNVDSPLIKASPQLRSWMNK
ncbi:DUF1643 domain-containing protein [Bacillus amyloliquefaciens]|uniref:DUF1643 domain-containing protein n=1 Tax=Bacillus amyloliquefaciens TaxID=1390 RepID=UPI0015811F53|nr:DUF1643 domain-containing protein [Bacillus amyloliquefaciens]NUI61414.1 DUF1643 domain-containing protein [Bacillus amyloliquefaciens]